LEFGIFAISFRNSLFALRHSLAPDADETHMQLTTGY
jgi:hypothetical protein